MDSTNVKDLEKTNISKLSGAALKKHLIEMLDSTAQCQAIFECFNHDTGEFRIVLQGIIEPKTEPYLSKT